MAQLKDMIMQQDSPEEINKDKKEKRNVIKQQIDKAKEKGYQRKVKRDVIKTKKEAKERGEIIKQEKEIVPIKQKIQTKTYLRQVIKVEPIETKNMHFEKGDIVLGKCRNQKPWPAKIVCFRGYSENNTEIYKVSFFGSKTWANLESCNLDYLGKKKAQRVNELRKSEKNFKKSVQMAMRKLQAIENQSQADEGLRQHFKQKYDTEQLDDIILITSDKQNGDQGKESVIKANEKPKKTHLIGNQKQDSEQNDSKSEIYKINDCEKKYKENKGNTDMESPESFSGGKQKYYNQRKNEKDGYLSNMKNTNKSKILITKQEEDEQTSTNIKQDQRNDIAVKIKCVLEDLNFYIVELKYNQQKHKENFQEKNQKENQLELRLFQIREILAGENDKSLSIGECVRKGIIRKILNFLTIHAIIIKENKEFFTKKEWINQSNQFFCALLKGWNQTIIRKVVMQTRILKKGCEHEQERRLKQSILNLEFIIYEVEDITRKYPNNKTDLK